MIKNIIFDFNGTILDDVELCFDLENQMLKEYGLKVMDKEYYLNHFSFPVKDYYIALGYDFNKLDYHQISIEFLDKYEARCYKEAKLFPGLKELLVNLKRENFKLYVLSASEINLLNNQLKDLDIYDYFDGIVGCTDSHAAGKIQYGKEYLERNNIDPRTCFMLGDTKHDYEVGVAIGMPSGCITFGHNSRKLLEELNTNLFDSYDEFFNFVMEKRYEK